MAIALAVATGISPTAWAAEGEQAMVTAVHLLRQRGSRVDEDDDGPQMSG
ncbi:hypothetical protein [Micromonospora aurantiaca (nom. illeg.)]